MHDPQTLIASFGPFTLWHNDPCRGPGGDDTCGWFMRSHHGDPEMLAKIEKAIAFDFDRVFKSYDDDLDGNKHNDPMAVPKNIYHLGLFCPNGDPNFSTMGIVLNLFWVSIHAYYGHNWRKSQAWMQRNLFRILIFAENPTDSLREGIVGTFHGSEKYKREERIRNYATCIYGWILRTNRPWWKHPRWHIHHWKLHCRPFWRRQESACCESRPVNT